jgi:hypothetical protein
VTFASLDGYIAKFPGLNPLLDELPGSGIPGRPKTLEGRITYDPQELFSEGTWVVKTLRGPVPIGGPNIAILTFYSAWFIHDTPSVVGNAIFYGQFSANKQYTGNYSWSSEHALTLSVSSASSVLKTRQVWNIHCSIRHLTQFFSALTAAIILSCPRGVRNPIPTATFSGWTAKFPESFGKFFSKIVTGMPGQPAVVRGSLLFYPAVVEVENRWEVRAAVGKAQLTLWSTLLGPILPIGFAMFSGDFPDEGIWEGKFSWERRLVWIPQLERHIEVSLTFLISTHQILNPHTGLRVTISENCNIMKDSHLQYFLCAIPNRLGSFAFPSRNRELVGA